MTPARLLRTLAVPLLAAGCLADAASAQQPPTQGAFYNTVKQKLAAGQQVVGATVLTPDPDVYCAVAGSGVDFTWIEMQHSPLTYQDVARMVMTCRGAQAIPFIRVPDATEGDIQKAADLGALGIIIPMVDTVEKARNAVLFAKYPPMGRRSQGNGQYATLYAANNYRQTANDNIMVVALIENPAGVAIVDQIAAVPGIDVVFVASTDLGSFSGFRQGDAQYEALVTKVLDTTTRAGLRVGGPLAWKDTRQGYSFFQGPDEAALIRCGAHVVLGITPTGCPGRGVAATEGARPPTP
jgi:2-keto-3-deoxy-L-rhamnonate aldolase RhmA